MIKSQHLLLAALVFFSGSLQAREDVNPSWKIVNYWSEWCAPCRVEIPMLNELSSELASSGVVVLGINFDEDPREKTLEIAEDLDIQFSVLTMDEVKKLALKPPDVLPTTYILASDNTVAAKLIGEQSEEEILESLLNLGLNLQSK